MTPKLNQLKSIVINTAREELLPRFNKVKRERKTDGSIITEADIAVQQRIANELKNSWPNILFVGEEMAADEQKRLLHSGESVWCLDPLDGTSNFAGSIPYFSISLALLEQGQVTAGVVYDPVRDECFAAARDMGAFLNDQRLVTKCTEVTLRHSTALVDFKRLPDDLSKRLVTETPYASQRSFGSVALEWCWIAAGRCHVYLHGKQNIWDYAAGNLVFHEAGGYSETLSGEVVFRNDLKPRSVIAALDKHLFDEWVTWLGNSG